MAIKTLQNSSKIKSLKHKIIHKSNLAQKSTLLTFCSLKVHTVEDCKKMLKNFLGHERKREEKKLK